MQAFAILASVFIIFEFTALSFSACCGKAQSVPGETPLALSGLVIVDRRLLRKGSGFRVTA
jgi:hypothetical protein